MGLLRRPKVDMPDDPFTPVLTRIVSTTVLVTSSWWMPGAWVGNGCHLEGLTYGNPVDEDRLEELVTQSGAAFDVVLTEPLDLIRQLLSTGRDRDELWFDAMFRFAAETLPPVLDELWKAESAPLSIEHVKLIGAVFMHPISCCWPVDGDRYHIHCLVPSRIYCDDPDCPEHH